MDTAKLQATIAQICQPGHGILAADESSGTVKKRFDTIGVENTENNRRSYRGILFSAPGLEENISGVILYDETVDQADDNGTTFAQLLMSRGVVPGIKVDTGKDEHPDHAPQTLTHGLDGLGDRLEQDTKRSNGALGFTKWRQVILVDPEPTDAFLEEAMDVMAQYATIAHTHGYVPITEPEVLMDGDHSLEQCRDVTDRTLKILYRKLEEHNVDASLTLLKPNMVLSGKSLKTDTPEEIATATLDVFEDSVPANVPGIVFLSGGQTPVQATENLHAINVLAAKRGDPWFLSYSYGRALQEDALKAWAGNPANDASAQAALLHRGKMNGLAQTGQYHPRMEEVALAA